MKTPTPPSTIKDMANNDYHNVGGVSKSTLDLFARDKSAPAWSRSCPQDQERLKTFDFGDAAHAICLEPERLKSEFVEMPAFNLRSNAGKQERDEFMAEHEGFKVLTAAEYKQLHLMYESVMAHPEARALIEADGLAEQSYFWRDEKTGLVCKCRPDKNIQSQGLLVDVKTTPCLAKFHFAVDDYRYYVQDPWYCDGVARFEGDRRMEFLVIQKTIEIGRYPVMVVKLPEEAIEYGRMQYRENLDRYAEHINHPKNETRELTMSWRFMEQAMEATSEITI